MKSKRALSSYVLLVGVMGLSIVGGVLAYQLYSASTKSQETPQQKEAIKPIDGVINQATIDQLSKRDVLNDSVMGQLLRATPALEPTPTLEATLSPTLEPTPTLEASSAADIKTPTI